MIIIESARLENIPKIQELSHIVWPVTFASILSEEQISYMMEMMYSTKSLTKQMSEDQHKYILAKDDNGEYLAYLSYQHDSSKAYTKIHKIYVMPKAQGKGVGKLLIDFVVKKSKENNIGTLLLNVNRYNKALDFYIRLGFNIVQIENINIGNDYLMEDYAMKMELKD